MLPLWDFGITSRFGKMFRAVHDYQHSEFTPLEQVRWLRANKTQNERAECKAKSMNENNADWSCSRSEICFLLFRGPPSGTDDDVPSISWCCSLLSNSLRSPEGSPCRARGNQLNVFGFRVGVYVCVPSYVYMPWCARRGMFCEISPAQNVFLGEPGQRASE